MARNTGHSMLLAATHSTKARADAAQTMTVLTPSRFSTRNAKNLRRKRRKIIAMADPAVRMRMTDFGLEVPAARAADARGAWRFAKG
jgi:hypothetical protein